MAKVVTSYKIVMGVTAEALEDGVMEYAKEGYIPVGGPFVFGGHTIGQAIVKKEQKEQKKL